MALRTVDDMAPYPPVLVSAESAARMWTGPLADSMCHENRLGVDRSLLVGLQCELLRRLHLLRQFDSDFEVAGTEVADLPNVTAEVAVLADNRVERQVEEDVLLMWLKAAEVAGRAEVDVVLHRFHVDVLAEPREEL